MKEGWTYKTFGEVFDLQMGRTPDRKNPSLFGGDNIWVSIRDIDGKYIDGSKEHITNEAVVKSGIKLVKKGTVIMSFKLTVGKCAIARKDLYTNEAIMAFNVNEDFLLDSSFLYYYLQDYQWSGTNKAVMGLTLNKATISKQKIAIPPLDEQERIVAELDLLSRIIDKKKAQLKELDQLAQSIFYTMFGDPITNEKGWKVKTIGDTCSITCGQDYKSVKDDNGQYPIYGTGGIMGWANQYRCPKHSVIIGRKGNINNPILVDVDFWNVDTAFGITPKNEELKVVYFFFFCKEYDFTKHDVSVTIPSLRRIDILKIKFPLPPLPLQQEFASKIEAIERQKSLIQQSIVETQTLFDSRMEHWFN